MTDDFNLHEQALAYAARGIRVFPLEVREKHPPQGTNGFHGATTNADDINGWWGANPDANIGIATGLVNMIVVLDIDVKKDGPGSLIELEKIHGALPETWCVLTGGGGAHYYFQHPGPLARCPNSTAKIAPGIDIRGDGGYAAAPPSMHPNGSRYLWEIGFGPDEIPVAPMPQWLRAKVIESPTEAMAPKELPERVAEGGRADAVTSFCGTLRRRGMPMGEIADYARKWNADHCVPPLPDGEVDSIARSVARYTPSSPQPKESVPMGATPPAEEKPTRAPRSGSSKLDGPALHATLEEDLPRWMAQHHIGVNAIGEVTDSRDGSLCAMRIDEIIVTYANHFRRCRQYVAKQYVEEVMAELLRERTLARRDELAKRVLALRGGTNDALCAWLKAVTGDVRELDVAVMRHWIWQVKRSMAGKPIDHQLMPILLGPQGSGKSTAARLLCGPLDELACVPASGEMITDPRSIPSLAKFYAGVWDEMEGADRGSIEAIKRAITSAKLTYKPLYTNAMATVRVTMQWFGTSNKSVASMVKDATGNRRFIEIESLPHCDWDGVGKVDYTAVWSCVDHDEPAPITPVLHQLVDEQRTQVFRDTVTAWLHDEEWREYIDGDGVRRPSRSSFVGGIPSREMQSRYVRWCDYSRERVPLAANALGMRLKEEGWRRRRTGVEDNGYRGAVYVPPASYLPEKLVPPPPFEDAP